MAVQAYAAIGCQITHNIFSEIRLVIGTSMMTSATATFFINCHCTAHRSQSGSPFKKLRESGCFGGFIPGCVFEEARCEALGENRSKNGRGKHQHEDHVEQPAIKQAFTGGISSVECD